MIAGYKMGEGRRGRIPVAQYEAVVGRMLTRDWFTLDTCDMLTQLDLIESLVTAHPARYPSRGAAVRRLLDKAMDQVIAACEASGDTGSIRIAEFLRQRRNGIPVVEIARTWGISREYVSRTVSRRATQLVTRRVLALGRRTLIARQLSETDGRRSA
jgi:hypothetical protein